MGPDQARAVSRRHLLLGGAAAGIGAAIGGALTRDAPLPPPGPPLEDTTTGTGTVPFHGVHQAGIATPPPAHTLFVALDLLAGTDRGALRRLLRILTDDAARLTQGRAALADAEPELATTPARLTVTFGFGPGLVTRAAGAGAVPAWLRPLPPFTVDRLEESWCGGDLLLHVCADDPLTVAHAARMLLKDSRSFATVRWTQAGFRRARGAQPAGTTQRNLFGQVDGTVNPQPGTADFDRVVWCAEPGWLRGGTSLVLRRIHMDLDGWDQLDRSGREAAVGRTLATGAPLTGTREHDDPDFEQTTPLGLPVIAPFAHIRRSRSENPAERIYRRPYSYDADPAGTGGVSSSGLLFASYQADVDAQYVPLQRRLDELDLLNTWTTPIGSAVFAIPPGCAPGGFVGDTLLG